MGAPRDQGATFGAAAALVAFLLPSLARSSVSVDEGSTSGYVASLGEGLRFIGADRLLWALWCWSR